MKKVLLGLLVLCLVACNDDDRENTVTPGYLVRHSCTYANKHFEKSTSTIAGRVPLQGKETIYVYGCADGEMKSVMSRTLIESENQ